MHSIFPEDILGTKILEGNEKGGLFKGKKWSIHEGGIVVDEKSILWKDIEWVYISASSYSVNFVPMGDTFSITIVDSSEKRIKLTLSSSLLDRGSKRKEFSNVYSHILSFIEERQWKEFIQRINDGQRVSFSSFDITRDGIYCAKKGIFSSGFDKLELKSIFGSAIQDGVFYIRFVNNVGKLMEQCIDHLKNIPNVHIAQRYLELLRSTYYRRV